MFGFRWLRFLNAPGGKEISPAAWFSSLPVLQTDRLVLRPVKWRDASDIFAYASDPEVARYVLWEPHKSLSDSRAFVGYARSLYRRGAPGSWVAELRKTGHVIGTIGIVWYSDVNRSAEVGYSFAREHWNQGYATESLQAVIDAAFTALPLNRLEAQHDIRNPASGRVMEKCGMKQEGVLRQRVRNKGEYADVAMYSLLRSDLEPQSVL